MGRKARLEGGFAYQNEGKTQNCYAAVKVGAGKSENAGFIYDNRGEALHCFTRSTVRGWKRRPDHRKQRDGFAALGSGKVSQCFFSGEKQETTEKVPRHEAWAVGGSGRTGAPRAGFSMGL